LALSPSFVTDHSTETNRSVAMKDPFELSPGASTLAVVVVPFAPMLKATSRLWAPQQPRLSAPSHSD